MNMQPQNSSPSNQPSWKSHGRDDQLVLGLEVVVQRHPADAALALDVVQARGVEAVLIEDPHGGIDQFVSAAGGHGRLLARCSILIGQYA
jgi:hypothetical protein